MKQQDKAWDAQLSEGHVPRRDEAVASSPRGGWTDAIDRPAGYRGACGDLWFAPALMPLACYGPATASGVVLLAFLFSKRLWVTLPRGS